MLQAMKRLAVLLNIAVIVVQIERVISFGARYSGATWFRWILITVAACASLYAIWKSKPAESQGWIGLLLQRKALEEQQRIESLRKPRS